MKLVRIFASSVWRGLKDFWIVWSAIVGFSGTLEFTDKLLPMPLIPIFERWSLAWNNLPPMIRPWIGLTEVVLIVLAGASLVGAMRSLQEYR